MRRNQGIFVLLASLTLLLSGCAGIGDKYDYNDPTTSLVFIHLDMSDAPTDVSWGHLHQVAPKAEEGYWPLGVADGLLFRLVPSGSYQMSNFGGSGFLAGEHEYSFATYGKNVTALRIASPGIYYIGSYKYEKVDTGFFEQGKFSIAQVESPTERELLQRLAGMEWVPGTQWVERIRTRLAELGG